MDITTRDEIDENIYLFLFSGRTLENNPFDCTDCELKTLQHLLNSTALRDSCATCGSTASLIISYIFENCTGKTV
jgi:hypothetical protein